jgi:hypothetical protein
MIFLWFWEKKSSLNQKYSNLIAFLKIHYLHLFQKTAINIVILQFKLDFSRKTLIFNYISRWMCSKDVCSKSSQTRNRFGIYPTYETQNICRLVFKCFYTHLHRKLFFLWLKPDKQSTFLCKFSVCIVWCLILKKAVPCGVLPT